MGVCIFAQQVFFYFDDFLGARGYPVEEALPSTRRAERVAEPLDVKPLDFVCEEDVKAAIRAGTKLVLSDRAIVTPSARDLAEAHQIFRPASPLSS